MVDTITGKSPDKLEEKVAKFRKLKAERQELLARLEKVEDERGSVSDRIYNRVRTEYAGKLDNVQAALDPIGVELKRIRKQTEGELTDLEEPIRLLEEELVEAAFRNRVGEYSDETLSEIKTRLGPELAEKSDRRKELQDTLATIASADNLEISVETLEHLGDTEVPDILKQAKEAGVPEETEPAAGQDETETPGQDVDAEPGAGAESDDKEDYGDVPEAHDAEDNTEKRETLFENPQDWIDELGEDIGRKQKTGKKTDKKADKKTDKKTAVEEPVGQSGDDDPLSALADPSDEKRETEAAGDDEEPEEPVSVGFPNLVIVTGHSSGKKIPLLPMTMSIGREHDNNIELKDPEVARYHARIMYERGHFVLEDMDSNDSTIVNGEPTKRATLKNGDKIRIGDTEMVIDFD